MSLYDPTDLTINPRHTEMRLPEPGSNPLLLFLRKSLQEAAEREKRTRDALAEHQAKADACTREREAIERAINAYQHQESPNMRADR